MKYVYILFILIPTLHYSQVGINTTSPNAKLDIRSSNQVTPTITDGILIPKIDEFPASNPTVDQDGMMLYVTGLGSVSKGFHFWNNTASTWTPLAGSLRGRAYAENTSYLATTATIPFDNTIPQSSEGIQILSTTITPLNSTNKLRVRVLVPLGENLKDELASVAVFRDSGVSAIAATAEHLLDKPNFCLTSC